MIGQGFEPRALTAKVTLLPSPLWASSNPVVESLCPSSPGPHSSLLSSAVHSRFYGPGAEHPAHTHLWLDPRLRGEPLQVLPASHLHTHAAGALHCHPGQGPVLPALLKPQTLQDPEGLGEGQCCQVHTANGPCLDPEDKPCVRSLHLALETRCRQVSALSLSGRFSPD